MNRRNMVAGVICVLLIVSCRRETPATSAKPAGPAATKAGTAPQDLRNAKVDKVIGTAAVEQNTDSRLGNHANPEGLVIEERNTFKRGEPVILSMTVTESPAGLQMSAVWEDAKGNKLDQDRKTMNGAKIATFAYAGKKKLTPGEYKVTGYWGGNVATEKKFTVTK
jgi:hypothetical protein